MAPRIVVVGSTMIDLIAYADRLPDDGETVVGTSYVTGFGGKGANQAVMAARFGAEVAMVNTVGDDDARDRVPRDSWPPRASIRRSCVACRAPRAWPRSGSMATGRTASSWCPERTSRYSPRWPPKPSRRSGRTVVIGQFEIPQATTAAGFAAARRIGAIDRAQPGAGRSGRPGACSP